MSAFHRIQKLAAQRDVHAAFQWLHLHEPQIRRWQMELVAIPAPPFGEAQRAAWLLERFIELKLENAHIDSEGNVLAASVNLSSRSAAEGPASPSLQTILLSAHLDTVFPEGTPCEPHEVEQKILAPGICDNAAGVVALLSIAAALAHANISTSKKIIFCGNVGEEGEGNLRGMRHIFSGAHNIQTAIALDGGGTDTVVTQALGSRRFRVNITGPGGHSWTDAGSPNPALVLSRALVAISELQLPNRPRTTLNIGTIAAGTSVNSIPQSAQAQIDTRSPDPGELLRLEVFLHRAVEDSVLAANKLAQKEHRAERLAYTISPLGDRPSATLPDDSPLLETIHAVDRHLSLKTAPRLGSTDANIPLSL
ncbi:MAG TPA: M20/M25/M40 family metallo-hydrolase, partial [Acidobacteriaceae bacterium]|nr:M20/M25/M40 family metallo-hydrolase [Acidobacteriaceae bacterium]